MDLRLGVFLLMIVSTAGKAQNFEIFSADINSTLNNSNSVGLKNATININLPLKLKKGMLTNSMLFSRYYIDYNTDETMNTATIESFKILKYTLGYFTKINDTWGFKTNISPTISSNFESGITMDDVFLNGSLVFIKSSKKGSIHLGLVYNTGFGTNKPIPIISYSRKVNNVFSYMLGMPITKIEYNINSANKANFYLKPKGFYSNISDNLIINTDEKAEKVKYKSIQTGVNYSHAIDDFWKLSLDAGYQFSSKYELLNNNESVYEFKTKNSFFVGLNLKYDLLKNKKN
ncbi:MAG: hypothetical protein CVU08_05115 [Bacteroidetes bacterium HGW-Bacteroidetes-3]|nr:MAG: hypothetical protein CVU08_05115 [Bacteroidetes bacterium HGW-Bacteroidetes-3]